ncbi:hypothetical protein Tco_0708895 [Tanacetum coccineum]
MRTRSSKYPNNSNVTIPRRQRKQVSILVELEIHTIVEMAERTMAELLRAPTEGYGEAIVLPEINADHFEIKTNLLQLVQANPFYGRESENPHAHINSFKSVENHMLQICPKFEDPPIEEEILSFIRDLGHTGEIKVLSDVNVNHMHQPWRSFAAIINKCLSGKTTALESLRLSHAPILWGMIYHSNETESERHVSSSRSRKDTHAEDADINSMNDKQPMAEKKVNRNTTPDSIDMSYRGGEIDQNVVKCQVLCPLLDPSFDNMTTEFSNQSPESKNISLKKTVAQLQKDVLRMELHCVKMELKYQNQPLKDGQLGQILNETSNKAKIKKEIQVLETINIELEHSMAKLLVENEKLHKENEHLKQTCKDLYDSIKKTRVQTKDHNDSLIAQIIIDVNNVLSKPVTPNYLPKVQEYVLAKPHHVISPGSSRNSQEESYGSNDMSHNYYLKEARKKTQERNRNSKPSVMHTTSLQNTTNGSKQKPRSNNQTSMSLPVSKSSGVTSNSVPLVDHFRNPSSFLDSKHFVCSTCQKCIFNANHDACVTKFLKEANSRVKVQSPKTRNSNKPVKQKSHTQTPIWRILTGHRFSPNKSSVVYEKTSPRSYLRWKPTGRIFNTVGHRWVPTRKIFTSSTTKVDSEPLNGSNEDITNPCECKQTLNVSACTLNLSAGTPFNPKNERLRVWLLKKLMSNNQVP